jgi:hypothetical protein
MPCRAEWFIGDLTTVERLHTVARHMSPYKSEDAESDDE